jgi:hypothetical protein
MEISLNENGMACKGAGRFRGSRVAQADQDRNWLNGIAAVGYSMSIAIWGDPSLRLKSGCAQDDAIANYFGGRCKKPVTKAWLASG